MQLLQCTSTTRYIKYYKILINIIRRVRQKGSVNRGTYIKKSVDNCLMPPLFLCVCAYIYFDDTALERHLQIQGPLGHLLEREALFFLIH